MPNKFSSLRASQLLHGLLFVICGFWTSMASADMTIVILRHAEKPDQGLGQLTCQGLNRALALAPVLLSRYGRPDIIYAPNPAIQKKDKGIPYSYVRPLATIEPLAIRVGLPITFAGAMDDTQALARKLTARSFGTQIVVWEHHWAETLARQLLISLGGNSKDIPRWEDDDYDSLFVIRVQTGQAGSTSGQFVHDYEGLNGLSSACPGSQEGRSTNGGTNNE